MADTLYLIDASGYIFRAFHALPPLTTKEGLHTGAVFGYAALILRLLQEQRPVYLAAAFDASRKTFRNEQYAEYKANRPAMPPELVPQIELIREVTRLFRIPMLLQEGFEADDLIASAVQKARALDLDVVILSGDKDLMQLVTERVKLHDPLRHKVYGPPEVEEKFGVPPALIPDLLGLMGDTSDNIPGVPGIGEKTGAELLKTYGSLEKVLLGADAMKPSKRRDTLKTHAENARLSKRLATLNPDAKTTPDALDAYRFPGIDAPAASALFSKLEFHKLAGQLAPQTRVERTGYRIVAGAEALAAEIAKLQEAPAFSITLEPSEDDLRKAVLIGLSLCAKEGDACYVPLGHRYLGAPAQCSPQEALAALAPLLTDPNKKRYHADAKAARILLSRYGATLGTESVDVSLASYLLDPDDSHDLGSVARRHLGHELRPRAELLGKGKKQQLFEELEVPRAAEFAAERADVVFRSASLLPERLSSAGLLSLLQEVEQPLSRLLGEVEQHGLALDVEHLRKLSQRFGEQMQAIEKRCHELAGAEFNVGSPKQLQEILFEKLKLPVGKRTKTGPSTDSAVLEELDHPLAKEILAHRQLSKLKGTYLDALPALVNPKTQRIHTSLHQTVAATGRLSSSDPNLQNIPVRTEDGREIRRAFIAPPGTKLVSLDYSQIELRLLAHFSGDASFVEAFRANEDIHKRAAAEIFHKPIGEVSADERRISKTITFGVIYGMGPFRLKQELNISQAEAQDYITRYFARYAGIRKFLDDTIAQARAKGELRTILNRRRRFADLNSSNHALRSYAERTATNSPIQGSAADVIKLAMLRVDRAMKSAGLFSKMLLQVHDELLFESPLGEVETLIGLAKTEMEAVGPQLGLRVPLLVEAGSGQNWAEAH
jgi:DNA polymerase-1